MLTVNLLLLIVHFVLSFFSPNVADAATTNHSISSHLSEYIKTTSTNINPKVYNLALHAVHSLDQHGVKHRPILAIIDYSLASSQKRLWVIDLRNHHIDLNTFVAHGKGSGMSRATRFSNMPGSHASSLGLFLTGQTYFGHHGKSLRLRGLEHGINDKALTRDVVIHGAAYVSGQFVKAHGRTGRSWGCPAIPMAQSQRIINELKGGAVVFAYYPDSHWLNHSSYLV